MLAIDVGCGGAGDSANARACGDVAERVGPVAGVVAAVSVVVGGGGADDTDVDEGGDGDGGVGEGDDCDDCVGDGVRDRAVVLLKFKKGEVDVRRREGGLVLPRWPECGLDNTDTKIRRTCTRKDPQTRSPPSVPMATDMLSPAAALRARKPSSTRV